MIALRQDGRRVPSTRGLTLEQGHHGAERRVEAGDRVADGHADAHRWPVRVADQFAEAAEASATAANPGAADSGPVCPNAEIRVMTRSGLTSFERLGSEAPLLQRAGTEVLQQDVALADQVQRRSAGPPRCFRSSTIDFLLRLIVRYSIDVLPEYSRQLRSSSPVSGRSTLMTSAPKSASMPAGRGRGDVIAELQHSHARRVGEYRCRSWCSLYSW